MVMMVSATASLKIFASQAEHIFPIAKPRNIPPSMTLMKKSAMRPAASRLNINIAHV